jgi:type I restriction enzyme S subunit
MTMADNKDKKVLNVPALRFPEFTDEWKKIRLGDNCSIQMCKRIMAAQTNTEGGVPFYKIGTIGGKADAYISKDLFDEYKRKYSYPNKGEVMITCAGTVGKCVIYDGEDSYYQDSNIVWIDNPNEIISNDFLYHLLSNINWSYLNSTTIVRIYNDDLRNLKLCCPRLDEQKKIARFLSLINERIATQNKIIEDLRLLRDAIMVEHYRKCNKSELCIYDIGEPFNVMNLSKDDLTKDGSPCIIYGELFTTYGCVIENVVSHTTKSLNSTLSIKGDLLFPASTTVDALSLIAPSSINEDGIILGGDMFGIHVNEQYNSNYLSYYFNIIGKKNLAKYAKGSTIIHLHYADIQKAKITLPNNNEQEAVANLLLKVEHKLNIEQKMLINYLNIKNFLLRQMFI